MPSTNPENGKGSSNILGATIIALVVIGIATLLFAIYKAVPIAINFITNTIVLFGRFLLNTVDTIFAKFSFLLEALTSKAADLWGSSPYYYYLLSVFAIVVAQAVDLYLKNRSASEFATHPRNRFPPPGNRFALTKAIRKNYFTFMFLFAFLSFIFIVILLVDPQISRSFLYISTQKNVLYSLLGTLLIGLLFFFAEISYFSRLSNLNRNSLIWVTVASLVIFANTGAAYLLDTADRFIIDKVTYYEKRDESVNRLLLECYGAYFKNLKNQNYQVPAQNIISKGQLCLKRAGLDPDIIDNRELIEIAAHVNLYESEKFSEIEGVHVQTTMQGYASNLLMTAGFITMIFFTYVLWTTSLFLQALNYVAIKSPMTFRAHRKVPVFEPLRLLACGQPSVNLLVCGPKLQGKSFLVNQLAPQADVINTSTMVKENSSGTPLVIWRTVEVPLKANAFRKFRIGDTPGESLGDHINLLRSEHIDAFVFVLRCGLLKHDTKLLSNLSSWRNLETFRELLLDPRHSCSFEEAYCDNDEVYYRMIAESDVFRNSNLLNPNGDRITVGGISSAIEYIRALQIATHQASHIEVKENDTTNGDTATTMVNISQIDYAPCSIFFLVLNYQLSITEQQERNLSKVGLLDQYNQFLTHERIVADFIRNDNNARQGVGDLANCLATSFGLVPGIRGNDWRLKFGATHVSSIIGDLNDNNVVNIIRDNCVKALRLEHSQ